MHKLTRGLQRFLRHTQAMRVVPLWYSCIAAFGAVLTSPFIQAQTNEFNKFHFTEQEQLWIQQHPIIRFTGDPNWLPFEAFNQHGEHIGIVASFVREIEQRTGLQFERVPSKTWTHAVSLATSGAVDVISDDIENETVMRGHIFTQHYMSHPLVIISRRKNIVHIRDLNEIKHFNIGVIRGYGYIWLIKENFPTVPLIESNDVQTALTQLNSGELDYFISTYTLSNYHMNKMGFSNLQVSGQLPISMKLGFGVRKDWPELLSILNKTIQSMSTEERYHIAESWLIENSRYLYNYGKMWTLLIIFSLLILGIIIWLIAVKFHQRKLMQSEQRYNEALRVVFAGIWEVNCQNWSFYISQTFMERLGYDEEDIPRTSQAFLKKIHPDDVVYFKQALIPKLKSQNAHESFLDIRFRILDTGQQPVWVQAKGRTIEWDKNGRALRRSGTIESIDTLVKSELELEKSKRTIQEREDFLQILVENIPDNIYLRDMDGRFVYCNKALLGFFGIAKEDIIGKTAAELLDPKNAERTDREDYTDVENSLPKKYATWLVSFDRSRRGFFETSKVPIKSGEKFIGVLSISRDLTERHTLLQELEKFKQFAEHSGQGFRMATTDAKVIYKNPALRKLLGLNAAQNAQKVLNETNEPVEYLYQYYPAEIRQRFQRDIIPHVLQHGYWRGELKVIGQQGQPFPTLETFFIIQNEKGQALYIGDILVDISEEKKVMEELEQARILADKANTTKSIFLANMSHEIRTPLNAIMGYSQLLLNDSDIEHEPKRQIQLIYNAGQRLLSLINDILDLSKIEAGKFSLSEDLFNLEDELRDIVELMRAKAERKHLYLHIATKLPPPESVKTDRGKFGQLLLNLLSNAIKFTEEGGIEVSALREGDMVTITVSDTGHGISEDELRELFQPFAQGKAGIRYGGTGLGLILSKKIVEAMGGFMRIFSEQEIGATVQLELPLPQYSQTTHKPALKLQDKPQLDEGSIIHALVVDDDRPSRDILCKFLQDIGARVDYANDGKEALRKLRTLQPAIIFTDIRMPGLTGIELLANLQEDDRFKQTPIIAVTASSLAHERSYYIQQGFDDFVGKPILFDCIIEVLDRHLHLTWQQHASTAKTELIAQPPTPNAAVQKILAEIIQAAQIGDFDNIQVLNDKLRQCNGYTPFSEKLNDYLQRYDVTAVCEEVAKLLA